MLILGVFSEENYKRGHATNTKNAHTKHTQHGRTYTHKHTHAHKLIGQKQMPSSHMGALVDDAALQPKDGGGL